MKKVKAPAGYRPAKPVTLKTPKQVEPKTARRHAPAVSKKSPFGNLRRGKKVY